jgi:hypothetical protein
MLRPDFRGLAARLFPDPFSFAVAVVIFSGVTEVSPRKLLLFIKG